MTLDSPAHPEGAVLATLEDLGAPQSSIRRAEAAMTEMVRLARADERKRATVAVTEAGLNAMFEATQTHDYRLAFNKLSMKQMLATALREAGVGVVPSKARMVDEVHNHIRVCPDCRGDGDLGHNAYGQLVACENCGGHEDAPGTGLIGVDDFAAAVLDAIGGQRDR